VRAVHVFANRCADAAADAAADTPADVLPNACADIFPDATTHDCTYSVPDERAHATTYTAPVHFWQPRLRQVGGRYLLPHRRRRVPVRLHGGLRGEDAARAAAPGAPVPADHSLADYRADAGAHLCTDGGANLCPNACRDAVPDASSHAGAADAHTCYYNDHVHDVHDHDSCADRCADN